MNQRLWQLVFLHIEVGDFGLFQISQLEKCPKRSLANWVGVAVSYQLTLVYNFNFHFSFIFLHHISHGGEAVRSVNQQRMRRNPDRPVRAPGTQSPGRWPYLLPGLPINGFCSHLPNLIKISPVRVSSESYPRQSACPGFFPIESLISRFPGLWLTA